MLEKVAEYIEIHESLGDHIPMAAGLADFLGVSKRVLYDWADKHPKFLHMLDKMNGAQERKLISNGLDGTYQPTIAKLILSKHGYHDKVDSEVTGKDGDELKITVKVVRPSD